MRELRYSSIFFNLDGVGGQSHVPAVLPRETDQVLFLRELIQWEIVYFPGVKRPKPEFNFSPSSSVEVESMWSHTSTLSINLNVMELDNILLFLHSAVTGLHCCYSHVQTEERGDINRCFANL